MNSPAFNILTSQNEDYKYSAVEEWDLFVQENNDLLNAKTTDLKLEWANSLVSLNNEKQRHFPLVMSKIYSITKEMKRKLF